MEEKIKKKGRNGKRLKREWGKVIDLIWSYREGDHLGT
jgi:hypothetical protein